MAVLLSRIFSFTASACVSRQCCWNIPSRTNDRTELDSALSFRPWLWFPGYDRMSRKMQEFRQGPVIHPDQYIRMFNCPCDTWLGDISKFVTIQYILLFHELDFAFVFVAEADPVRCLVPYSFLNLERCSRFHHLSHAVTVNLTKDRQKHSS